MTTTLNAAAIVVVDDGLAAAAAALEREFRSGRCRCRSSSSSIIMFASLLYIADYGWMFRSSSNFNSNAALRSISRCLFTATANGVSDNQFS